MSGSNLLLLGGNPQAVPVDPQFYSVTALLHGNGTNGAQNNTFLDSSSNNFTITRNGNTTQGSFGPYGSLWSNYFDGTANGYLSTPATTDLDLSGDFTLQAWIFPTADSQANGSEILSRGAPTTLNGWHWYYYNNKLNFGFNYSGFLGANTSTIPKNVWTHVALTRSGNNFTYYFNGVSNGTFTSSATPTINGSDVVYVARASYDTTNRQFPGYISNISVIKGTALTTFNITTPLSTSTSGQSLLTCTANRFLDANTATTAKAITAGSGASVQPFSPFNLTNAYSASSNGGSGYFDGSGDYLNGPSTGQFAPTGNFTISMWIYPTSFAASYYVLAGSWNTGTSDEWLIQYDNTGAIRFLTTTDSTFSAAGVIKLNQWQFLSISRTGNTLTGYVNGTSFRSYTLTGTVGSTTKVVYIGAQQGTTWPYVGYMSDYRLVAGSAESATPPTSPATAISGTNTLLNFTNAGIFDNAVMGDYETVGNAQISTAQSKFNGSSMYFDGTGDYLVTDVPSTQLMAFGTGDFTVEMWVRFSAIGTNVYHFYDSRPASTDGAYPTLRTNASSQLEYVANSAVQITGATLSLNTWYHIALCRTASQTKLFVNGTQTGSTYADTTNYLNAAARPLIGGSGFHVTTLSLNGYMADVRISKGIARYPYNFTPPTLPFPNIGGTVTLTSDPYFDYTTLLLPGNGTNGAQNNTFLDSSTNAFSITRNGNTTQGTFSPFSQTGWGAYFNGSSDYISVADSVDFTMGSGDFTIQCWVYSTANSGSDQYILGQVNSGGTAAATSFQLYKKATSNVAEAFVYAGGSKVATGTAQIPVGQWTHLAMVRDGGTLRLYVNGSQDGTNATLSTTAITDSAGSFSVGRTGDYNGLYFAGYVSNVSVVKGTCLFPSGTTFTPSTTPLSTSTSGQSVLLCQANRFIDTNTATTAKTVTVGSTSSIQAFSPFNPTAAWSAATNGGSGYFDGSGDYLALPSSSNLALGTGDFCIETWVYGTVAAVSGLIGNSTSAGDGDAQYELQIGTSYYPKLIGWNSVFLTSSSVITFNQWNHLAVTRSGTTCSMFLNGTRVATATVSQNFSSTNALNIGRQAAASSPFTGYLSGTRIVKGSSVYDPTQTTCTVPTAPPTAITNTQLLTNFTNAGIYDATSKNDLETVGNAQISTTQSKFGGSSMYFDGTGDYLTLRVNDLTNFGSGDFTVEGWVRIASTGSFQVLFNRTLASTSGYGGTWIRVADTNVLQGAFSSGTSSHDVVVTGSTALATGTWYHFAWVRYGTSFKVYLNGVSDGSGTSSATMYASGDRASVATQWVSGSATNQLNGYINDLRITKGIARYTSTFTPPTTAFLTL